MDNKTNKKKGCRQVAQELGVQWTKMKPENNDNKNKRKKEGSPSDDEVPDKKKGKERTSEKN